MPVQIRTHRSKTRTYIPFGATTRGNFSSLPPPTSSHLQSECSYSFRALNNAWYTLKTKKILMYLYLVRKWWRNTAISTTPNSFPGQNLLPPPNAKKHGCDSRFLPCIRMCQIYRIYSAMLYAARLLTSHLHGLKLKGSGYKKGS